MSLADDRQLLAEAASEVPDITCSPYYSQSLSPGDAAVNLVVRNRASNGFGYVNTWQIWVAVSQDVADTEEWMDKHLDELLVVLEPHLYVNSITPSELLLAGGASVNGFIVEGARAAG